MARFLKDQSGATSIEYGVVCAMSALILCAASSYLTHSLNDVFAQFSFNGASGAVQQ